MNDTPSVTCPYCGRKVARNRRPHVGRRFFEHPDGTRSDFIGHRSCFLEMKYPDDPKVGHARHDIPVGR
jgi:hypothetical protein